jgi:hypothetical protein
MNTTRRILIVKTIGLCAALAVSPARAATPSQLAESDPAALALGYKSIAATVDSKRFPKYQSGQNCANCQFFQGGAQDATGGCPMFGTRSVARNGWCNAYAKRV